MYFVSTLRAGLAAHACRTVQGSDRAALAPALHLRKDRLVFVMIIFLLFSLCGGTRPQRRLGSEKCGKERHFWLRIFTANAVPDFSQTDWKVRAVCRGLFEIEVGDFRRASLRASRLALSCKRSGQIN
jgi:hypothetical protein